MKAAYSGKTEIARLLLERGADRGIVGTVGKLEGKTALDHAREINHLDVISLLEIAGAAESAQAAARSGNRAGGKYRVAADGAEEGRKPKSGLCEVL